MKKETAEFIKLYKNNLDKYVCQVNDARRKLHKCISSLTKKEVKFFNSPDVKKFMSKYTGKWALVKPEMEFIYVKKVSFKLSPLAQDPIFICYDGFKICKNELPSVIPYSGTCYLSHMNPLSIEDAVEHMKKEYSGMNILASLFINRFNN